MENIVTVVVADIDVGIILEKLLYHSVHFSGENSGHTVNILNQFS